MKRRSFFIFIFFLFSTIALPAPKKNSANFHFENSVEKNLNIDFLAKKTNANSEEKKSQKKKSEKENFSSVEEIQELPITKIEIDKGKKKKSAGYFSGIDFEIVALVEEGSPEALEKALLMMKKTSVNYEENERILVFCAAEILKVVWPSHNVWQSTQSEQIRVDGRSAYAGAIESARNGIYDMNTGNADFLARVLPSLVLCKNNARTDFFAQAEIDLKAALETNPQSVLANYLLGLLYSKMERNESAVVHLKAALEKSSAFEINFELASVLNSLGKFSESQNIVDRLIVVYPSNVALLKLLARNAFDRKDYSSAERYAMLVLTQNPADLDMVLFRAKVFVHTGEYLKAASLLDVYSKSNANSKDYLILRARVQKEWNKNFSEAISTIEKALSLYPEDNEVVLCAAELAGESGRNVGGKTGAQLSEQILSRDSENSQALLFLTKTMMEEEKWNDAYASCKKLVAKNSSAQAISLYVKISLALGYNEEAWSQASSLFERMPNEEAVIQTYVEAMVRTGRTAQASRFINSSIDNASSAMKSFFYYQRSFLAIGDAAQLSDLRSAVIANPRNSDALFRMYKIYFQRQDYRKAQYYLRQVIALNPRNSNYLKLNSELDKMIN